MSEVSKLSRPIKNIWRQQGTDFICDLTTMKKAIIVRYFVPPLNHHYAIARGSYFPFSEEQLNKRFNNPNDCIDYAEGIVLDWIKSIITNDGFSEQPIDVKEDKLLE